MGDFERDTRVQKVDTGHYRAEISRSWEVWGPNGGYLATIALRAAGDAASIKRPVTFHGHYLRVGRFEPVRLDVNVLQQGSRAESVEVRMVQNDKLVFTGLLRTCTEGEGLVYDEIVDADAGRTVPEPESLPLYDEHRNKYGADTFWRNFERRVIHPEYLDGNTRTKFARREEWLRFKVDEPTTDPFVDAGRSIVLLDTFMWPAVYRKMGDCHFIAPSLDITVFFHRSAMDSQWLRIDAQGPIAERGFIAGQGRVFDASGRTIASGYSQLMCVPEAS